MMKDEDRKKCLSFGNPVGEVNVFVGAVQGKKGLESVVSIIMVEGSVYPGWIQEFEEQTYHLFLRMVKVIKVCFFKSQISQEN